MALLKLILAFVTLPLLVVMTLVNTENIFQNNLLQVYVLIYVLYFLLSALGLLFFKRFRFKNLAKRQEWFSTLQFIFYICLLFLPAVWLVHYFILGTIGGTGLYLRSYGKVAFVYLVLALSVSPILTFVKNKKLSETLIVIRKILGILSFIFFMKHGLEYFSTEYLFALKHTPVLGYRNYVWQNLVIRYDALSGIVAGILMIVLGVTSNQFSITFLSGSVWKKVQSLVYPVFLISAIHVAFASRFDLFYIVLIAGLIFIRVSSYLAQKDKPNSGPTTKYLCVPCGYIYDEAIGDPDGGIAPGTKFEDIPDGWVCPVCGVTKSSFEPYYETPNTVFTGHMCIIIGYMMLTKDVLELSLRVDSVLTIIPGQYILLVLKDFDGEFTRSYSVVEYVGDTIKLGIKIKDTGRGSRTLKNLRLGDQLKIKDVYGNFVLKTTPNSKVFVATGTGFSPIYAMIAHNTYSTDNVLLWGVATKEDLYYVNQLGMYKNLQVELFLSQETLKGYHYGRVDATRTDFPSNTEFYLCGNPAMVTEQTKILKEKGYENIYSEIF